MVKIFELITGSANDVCSYIEKLETFESWQMGKDFYSQIERLLSRDCLMEHIGAVTYQGRDKLGYIVIHAAFVAITTPNIFLDDN